MDLLIMAATQNGLSPAGLLIKVPSDRPPGYIHYRPNTAIGRLNVEKIEIVRKSEIFDKPLKKRTCEGELPFEVMRLKCIFVQKCLYSIQKSVSSIFETKFIV